MSRFLIEVANNNTKADCYLAVNIFKADNVWKKRAD